MGAVGLNTPVAMPARGDARRSTAAPIARGALDPPPRALALTAFAALALLAGMRFAALLAHPPTARVLALVASATACGAALAATRRLPTRAGIPSAGRVAAIVVFGYLSLRAAGAPARELWPWHLGRLGDGVGRGLEDLDGLWPYRGGAAQARTVIMLGVAAAVMAAAVLVFWPGAARRGRARTTGLVILLALYGTAVANQPRSGWQFQGMLLVGLLAVWALAWTGAPPPALGRAGMWVLATAVGALAIGGLVHSSRPLIDYRHWNPFGATFAATSFDWNQTYGQIPWSRSNETMVEVASSHRRLLRATTLDRFDGTRFLRSARQPGGAPAADAAAAASGRWLTHTSVIVRGLSSTALLSPGAITAAAIAGAGVPRLAPINADGTLASATPIYRSGTRYTITAYAPRPTPAQMRRAPRRVPAAYLPYTRLSVPSAHGGAVEVSATGAAGGARIAASPYAPVLALARRLAAGVHSSYDRAAAIQAFLGRGFSYDETPPRRAFPLAAFLLRDRVGYCQQFSGAMTLLLRMDGIPARVAAGFLPGARDPSSGLFRVTARDAHSWVEVYFAGIGWVPFDPTPPRPTGGRSAPILAAAASGASTEAALKHRGRTRRVAGAATTATSTGLTHRRSTALLVALIALFALLAALGARRLIAGSRGGQRPDDCDGAVQRLDAALACLGTPTPTGTTLWELERGMERSHGSGASTYVRLLREQRYGSPGRAGAPGASETRDLRRALSAGRGPLLRLRLALTLAAWSRVARTGRNRRRRALEG